MRAGKVREDDWMQPTTMYGCNKLYCEQLGHVLRAALQAAGGRTRERPRGFPLRAVSRADLGGHDAIGRHVGLRAGDDSRRGERRALQLLRPARHADPVHGDARRRGRAADACGRAARWPHAHRLQRRGLQPVGGGNPGRRRRRRFQPRRSTGSRTRSGSGSSTRGRRTSTTAPPGATGASPRASISSGRSRSI